MDFSSVIQTIELFKPNDELMEVRCFHPKTKSGYFCDKENLLKHLKQNQQDTWYFVMNSVNPSCYSREQNEQILLSNKSTKTTSDKEIIRNEWLLIDVDPTRAVGISATDEEKEHSKRVITDVYKYLHNFGFARPVTADSGNGYHLLYKVDFKTSEENTEIIKKCLQVLDMMFSDSAASVDTSVFNPARITKLYGTIAKKGANTKNRPHRQSRIVKVPDQIQATSINLLNKLADLLPLPEPKPKYQSYGNYEQFDVDSFIQRHGIEVRSDTMYGDGRRIILNHCVFDPQHGGKDAAIFVLKNGAIGYKCFHDSCSDKTWQDVRLMFEPSAYDRKEEYKTRTTNNEKQLRPVEAVNNNEPAFKQLHEIPEQDRSKIIAIKTGLETLDKKIIGFNKGELSVWSGNNASGKSSVLSQIAIEAIDKGFKVSLFSGELTDGRVKQWLQLQCAGRRNTNLSSNGVSYWVKDSVKRKIDDWCKDKLWIYQNTKGLNVDVVFEHFKKHLAQTPCDVVIVDNLMSFDTADRGYDKYENQTKIVKQLKDLASLYNVHIHFVCHPKKSQTFLRKEDISGTADITNIADNVLIIHRVNKDFEKRAKEFLDPKQVEDLKEYSNVVEVMKNRDLGVSDVLVGLFFEVESKRFLNYKNENKVFGWEKENVQFMVEHPDVTRKENNIELLD